MVPTELEARARRAYEWGRWRKGLQSALWALPAIAFGAFGCSPRGVLLQAPLLVAACVFLVWRGGPVGRGVVLGLKAGTLPTLVPMLVYGCAWTAIPRACLLASLGGGVAAGLVVSGLVLRRDKSRTELVAAGVIAVLTGALGCQLFGIGGLLGLAAGLAAGATPGYVLSVRRA